MLISCKESRIENNRSFYGCFYLGPFSNSQSLTVANALRRSLLSEIKGLAIVSVQIENVNNEYSTLPGVKDSVLDILLNLKEIVFKKKDSAPGMGKVTVASRQTVPSAAKGEEEAQSLGEGPVGAFGMRERGLLLGKSSVGSPIGDSTVGPPLGAPVAKRPKKPLPISTFFKPILGYLKVKGPGVIRAKDLRLPPFIQCVDPSQYIATLADDGVLNVVFVIMEGKSYIIQKSPKNHSLVDATGACRVIQQRQVLVNRLKERIYTSLLNKGNSAFHLYNRGPSVKEGEGYSKRLSPIKKGSVGNKSRFATKKNRGRGSDKNDIKINRKEGKKSEKVIKLPPPFINIKRDTNIIKGDPFTIGPVSLFFGLGKESLLGHRGPGSELSIKKRKKAGLYICKRNRGGATSPLGKVKRVDGNSSPISLFPSPFLRNPGNKLERAGASPRQLFNKKKRERGTVGLSPYGGPSLSSFSSCLHLDAVFSPITKVNYVVLENEHYIIEKYNEKNNAISSISSFFSSLSFYPYKRLSASLYKGSGKRSDQLTVPSGPDFPLLAGPEVGPEGQAGGATPSFPFPPTKEFSSFNKEDVFSFVDSLETTEFGAGTLSSLINQRRMEKEQGNIVLEIWTNGSLHPRDALSLALKNLSLTFSTLQKLRIIHPIFYLKDSTSYKK